jgi:hypothetical protein
MKNLNMTISKENGAALRVKGWVSLTYPYKPHDAEMLVAAVRQLGDKPNRLVNCPGGVEIFVPGRTNKGLA